MGFVDTPGGVCGSHNFTKKTANEIIILKSLAMRKTVVVKDTNLGRNMMRVAFSCLFSSKTMQILELLEGCPCHFK